MDGLAADADRFRDCLQGRTPAARRRDRVSTTADAVTPGIVAEGERAIWQLGQMQVRDGGPDGIAATAGNTPFAVQGLIVP